MKKFLIAAALAAVAIPAAAADRHLHGWGDEGEELVLDYVPGPNCRKGEMGGTGTWPDGTVRAGCWRINTRAGRAWVRWRDDGPPIREWTVEYSSFALDLRYAKR